MVTDGSPVGQDMLEAGVVAVGVNADSETEGSDLDEDLGMDSKCSFDFEWEVEDQESAPESPALMARPARFLPVNPDDLLAKSRVGEDARIERLVHELQISRQTSKRLCDMLILAKKQMTRKGTGLDQEKATDASRKILAHLREETHKRKHFQQEAVLLRDQLLVNGFPQTALLRIYEQAHCVEVEDSNGLPLPPPPLMRQPAAGFAGQPRVDGSGQADEVSNFREEVRKRDDELWAKQEETTSLKDEVVSLKDEVLSLRKELNVRDHGLVGLEKSLLEATAALESREDALIARDRELTLREMVLRDREADVEERHMEAAANASRLTSLVARRAELESAVQSGMGERAVLAVAPSRTMEEHADSPSERSDSSQVMKRFSFDSSFGSQGSPRRGGRSAADLVDLGCLADVLDAVAQELRVDLCRSRSRGGTPGESPVKVAVRRGMWEGVGSEPGASVGREAGARLDAGGRAAEGCALRHAMVVDEMQAGGGCGGSGESGSTYVRWKHGVEEEEEEEAEGGSVGGMPMHGGLLRRDVGDAEGEGAEGFEVVGRGGEGGGGQEGEGGRRGRTAGRRALVRWGGWSWRMTAFCILQLPLGIAIPMPTPRQITRDGVPSSSRCTLPVIAPVEHSAGGR